MRPYRRRTKAAKDRGVNVARGAFETGTPVGGIVVPAGGSEPFIYLRTAALVKRRRIPRYTLKEIERIVHKVRGIRA